MSKEKDDDIKILEETVSELESIYPQTYKTSNTKDDFIDNLLLDVEAYIFEEPDLLNDLQKKFLIYYEATNRNLRATIKKFKITMNTFNNWRMFEPAFEKEIDKLDKLELSDVESILMHKILEQKDTASMIFYLKSKGKKNGWSEKFTIDEIDLEIERKKMELELLKEKVELVRQAKESHDYTFNFDILKPEE